jgi:hypothetical protein
MFHAFTVIEETGNPLPRRWRTTTLMYEYRLLDHPHLHVSASLRAQVNARDSRDIDLDRLHLPTDRVTFEAVIRMLISEFGIAPRRKDWQATLDRTEAMFREHRGR